MVSFLLSVLAIFMLTGLAVAVQIQRRSGANAVLSFALLVLASIELIGLAGIRHIIGFNLFRTSSVIAEALLPAAFLFLTLTFGRVRPFETRSKIWLGLEAYLAFFPLLILLSVGTGLYFSPDFRTEQVLFLSAAGYWFYLCTMFSLVLSLVQVETTLRASRGSDRNRIKFAAFGLMTVMSVLVFYYSHALLYRTIDINLIPVRSTVFLIGSGLLAFSLIFRGSSARVHVSRHILYRSVTLLIVGLYLVGLALMGEGMRYFGVTFGRDLTIVLAFVGGIFLLAVLFSEKARRKTKVYIHKHFYADKHDYRDEWIRLTAALSKCDTLQEALDGILTAYMDRFGFAGACLYLVNRDESVFAKATCRSMSHSPLTMQLSEELAAYLLLRERILNPGDGEYRLSSGESALFEQAKARLLVPLISKRKLEALVLLREQIVPNELTYDDYDLMKVMGRQAAQAIANLRLSEEVIEMRSMAAVAKISSFVIHDLKNLTSGLSLVVDNAALHIGNPAFQKEAIRTIGNTTVKMQALIQRLRSIPARNAVRTRVEDMDRLAREIVDEFRTRKRGLRIEYAGSPVFSAVDREEIKRVIVNLVQNAIDATGTTGNIRVESCEKNGNVHLSVSDDGRGMDEDFVKNELFRPFRTTKEKGLGIGLYQSKQIVDAHSGRIEVNSALSKGTAFTVILSSTRPDVPRSEASLSPEPSAEDTTVESLRDTN